MENFKTAVRSFLPILAVFLLTSGLLLAIPSLESWGINRSVVIPGNLILFAATAISFNLYKKSLRNNNVQVFLRMIYGGMFAKMMICLFAALIYIMMAKKNVSKGAIFSLMFLYFLYTFVEISIILKLSRREKYAKERGAA